MRCSRRAPGRRGLAGVAVAEAIDRERAEVIVQTTLDLHACVANKPLGWVAAAYFVVLVIIGGLL